MGCVKPTKGMRRQMDSQLWQVCPDCGELWCIAFATEHDCKARRLRLEREAEESARAARSFVGPLPEAPYARLRRKLKALQAQGINGFSVGTDSLPADQVE